MARLFDPSLAYACDDEGGVYLEFMGDVLEVGDPIPGDLVSMRVKVHTEKGDFDGYARCPSSNSFVPIVGHRAVIRVYSSGYSNHRVISWGTG